MKHRKEQNKDIIDLSLEKINKKNKIKNKYVTIYNYVDKETIIKKSKEEKFNNEYDLFFIGRTDWLSLRGLDGLSFLLLFCASLLVLLS